MQAEKHRKIGHMNEAAWVIGIFICSLGVCLCTRAGFGLSMIAAPPYILHLYFEKLAPWFTQGVAEYVWQAFLLAVMCIAVRRFRVRYLLSFAAAFIAGSAIDLWFVVLGGNTVYAAMPARIAAFAAGELCTSMAIAFVFRTTLPVQVYELIVREIAVRWHFDVNRVKLVNDITLFVLSAVMSFTLTGGWKGFGIGTILITFVNAPLIALWGKALDRLFTFEPRFPRLCRFFSGE